MTIKTNKTPNLTNNPHVPPSPASPKSYKSYASNQSYPTSNGLKPHGGYRNLLSFQTTTIIYDLTVIFIERYIPKGSRTSDQMVQSARSGRQNIAEGSQTSATSGKSEIFLTGVARASLEELLLDYEDYLRQHGLTLWPKDSPKAQAVRALAYSPNRSHLSYQSYCLSAEDFANTVICLIHQANYLLDRQLASLDKKFIEDGGYSENLQKRRLEYRKNQK